MFSALSLKYTMADVFFILSLLSLFSLHCLSMWTVFRGFSRTPLLLITARELLRRDFAAIYLADTAAVTLLLLVYGTLYLNFSTLHGPPLFWSKKFNK